MRVSVIIPCFNAARFLQDAIRSVPEQGHGDLELIIVDDGSSDGSDQVTESAASQDSRVRVFRQANSGVFCGSWNPGVLIRAALRTGAKLIAAGATRLFAKNFPCRQYLNTQAVLLKPLHS
jgi:glycosyltransferase involved in cell wall biosynthesis